MTEVIIDGVRYVPARDICGGVDEVRQALLDVFWGKGYRGSDPSRAEENLYVSVYDDPSLGGTPFAEFIDELIATLAER